MWHIITAIEKETKRNKEIWQRMTTVSESDEQVDTASNSYTVQSDEYCFQMLSMVSLNFFYLS